MAFDLRAGLCAALALALGLATQVFADSLTERRAPKGSVKPQREFEIACGHDDGAGCTVVAPVINAMTPGMRLKPLESAGGVESLDGVCDGDVEIALTELNVLAAKEKTENCRRAYAVFNVPLYLREGFLIARADAPYTDLAGMIGHLKSVDVVRISAGGPQTVSDLALRDLVASEPDWKARVDILSFPAAEALKKLRQNELDAVFLMEAPASLVIQEVRRAVSARTKQQEFRLININPNEKFLSIKFNGKRVYAPWTVEEGWFTTIHSIATPTVIVMSADFHDREPEAAMRILDGIQRALSSIAARVAEKTDWKQEFDQSTRR